MPRVSWPHLAAAVLAASTARTAVRARADVRAVPRPDKDPFYLPADPLPDAPPGTLIGSRPVTISLVPGVRSSARAWQLLYVSTNAWGKPNAVSGTLLVPRGLPRPRPIVSWGLGTHGHGATAAASYMMRMGREWEALGIAQLLARGWAVAVTDYEGLGTPGPHTYTVGPAEAHAMLDILRAAQRHPQAGLNTDAPVGILGYSGGGHAAAWAGELQPEYAPELPLAGIAAGGVMRDLEHLTHANDGGPYFGAVLMAMIGQAAADPGLPLESVLNENGRRAIADVKERYAISTLLRYRGHRLSEYVTLDRPLEDPSWQAALARNRCGQRAPGAPVLIYGGVHDPGVPYTETLALVADYRSLGADVTLRAYPLEHVGAAIAGLPAAATWLADRFGSQRLRAM